MKVLSQKEARIVRAIGQTFFPRDGALGVDGIDAGIAEFVDQYLARLTRWERMKVRALFAAFELAPAVGSLDGGRSFTACSHEERLDHLQAWENSSSHLRRKAFEGLRALVLMGFVSSGAVTEKLGIDATETEGDPVDELRRLADIAGRGVAE